MPRKDPGSKTLFPFAGPTDELPARRLCYHSDCGNGIFWYALQKGDATMLSIET